MPDAATPRRAKQQDDLRLPAAELFDALAEQRFDEIIDVRSPAEFAEDHAPGAVNLPVLDNAERALVGEIYVQESKFRARKIGAALVAQNIARHLETRLADKPRDYRPLVYCWRGGQRSGAMALVLRQIGWRAATLEGGYRGYRRQIVSALYDGAPWFRAVLIDGGSGAGKTALLRLLEARGRRVVDLEAVAVHRGSVFGAEARPQPSQKMFESRLYAALPRGRGAVVALEAESNRIGALRAPPALWTAMQAAPRIVLEAPAAARARRLAQSYGALLDAPEQLAAMIDRLPPRHSAALRAEWRRLAAEGRAEDLAQALLEAHYDPAYAKSARLQDRQALARIPLDSIDADDLARAADIAERALDAYAASEASAAEA